MSKSNRYSPEVRARAVRMVHEHRGQDQSLWAAIESIAPKIGCVPQTLNEGIRKSDDVGMAGGMAGQDSDHKELRRANKPLKLASAFFLRRSRAVA